MFKTNHNNLQPNHLKVIILVTNRVGFVLFFLPILNSNCSLIYLKTLI